MTQITLSLPDELVNYLNQKVEDKNTFIASLLEEYRQEKQKEELAQACLLIDELELGWSEECQQTAITDWEVSG